MKKIFMHGELEREAESYRKLLIEFQQTGWVSNERIVLRNRKLLAQYGSVGLSRIKEKAWGRKP